MIKRFLRRAYYVVEQRLQRWLERTLSEKYPNYTFGRGSYGGLKVSHWGESARLCVGSFTSFADGVKVYLGGEHRTDWVTTYPFTVLWESASFFTGHPKTKGDVNIGSDVWVGTEALIFSGVTIGDGAVVGARSVVTKDVPPYAIVAGNPASLVRYRFSQERINGLLAIRWWEWDDDRIETEMPQLLNDDIDEFIKRNMPGKY